MRKFKFKFELQSKIFKQINIRVHTFMLDNFFL